MASRGRPCKICANRSARALFDAELLSGVTIMEAFNRHADQFGILSHSSIYRHARNHLAEPLAAALAREEGERTGDIVGDLSRMRVRLDGVHRRAVERGDNGTAVRAAHEAHAVTQTLMSKLGITEDSIAAELAEGDRMVAFMRRAVLNRPTIAHELANAARQVGDGGMADTLDQMAEGAQAEQDRREAERVGVPA